MPVDATVDAQQLPAGTVLYVPFETSPSNMTIEDAARAHVVTCRTTCPTLVPGIRGNAFEFDATNPDVLQVSYAADLDPSAGFTIAAWIRMNALPPGPYFCVLGKPIGVDADNSHALCVDTAGVALYHSGTDAGTDNVSGSTVSVGQWHHLAMTWDGTTKRGYLDGVLDGMRVVPVENDSSPISIGADLNSGTPAHPLNGALDEVWVINRPLSDAEIQTLAQ
jgi:Concanavalin A-like lectin/glucanases superfamily